MKILGKVFDYDDGSWADQEISMADAVDRLLDGQDHDRGELETMSASISNGHRAVAWLLEKLMERHVLEANDMREFIGLFYKDLKVEE